MFVRRMVFGDDACMDSVGPFFRPVRLFFVPFATSCVAMLCEEELDLKEVFCGWLVSKLVLFYQE